MYCKPFIASDKETVKKMVNAFLTGAKDLTIMDIRNDLDYAKKPGDKKTFRTMIYYVKNKTKE